WSDARHPFSVTRRRWAKQDNVRLGFLEKLVLILKQSIGRHLKLLRRLIHSDRLIVAQGNNFNVGMLAGHPQIVAHVHVIETDAGNFPASHGSSLGLSLFFELQKCRIGDLIQPSITRVMMLFIGIIASGIIAANEGRSSIWRVVLVGTVKRIAVEEQ